MELVGGATWTMVFAVVALWFGKGAGAVMGVVVVVVVEEAAAAAAAVLDDAALTDDEVDVSCASASAGGSMEQPAATRAVHQRLNCRSFLQLSVSVCTRGARISGRSGCRSCNENGRGDDVAVTVQPTTWNSP